MPGSPVLDADTAHEQIVSPASTLRYTCQYVAAFTSTTAASLVASVHDPSNSPSFLLRKE